MSTDVVGTCTVIPLGVEGAVGLLGGPLMAAGGMVEAFEENKSLIFGVNALFGT